MDSGRIPDANLSSSLASFDTSAVRLKSNTVTDIGAFLKVNLISKSFVTGFAVRGQSSFQFHIKYDDAGGAEQDYQENGSPKVHDSLQNIHKQHVSGTEMSGGHAKKDR